MSLADPSPVLADVAQQPSDSTSVYRYYDANGILVYVGITHRGILRNAEHDKNAAWWPYVVRQEVDHLSSRKEALAREKALIVKYRPPFNTQHNMDARALREAYTAFAASVDAGTDSPLAVFRRLNETLHLTVVGRRDGQRNTYVLRTQADGLSVARHLVPMMKRKPHEFGDCPEVRRDGGMVVGRVFAVEPANSFTLVSLWVKAQFARWLREPLVEAAAEIRANGNQKPPTFEIRYVQLPTLVGGGS